MGTDHRRATRYDVEVSAEVYTSEAVLPAATRNLSETGVCFDVSRALDEDSMVGVSLFITSDGIEDPDAEPLNIKAKVAWCSEREDTGYSAGMRFDDLDEKAEAIIKGFLSQLS